jgi:phospholipid/cholesterol/gamma-HCH transport system substrate-binding protein
VSRGLTRWQALVLGTFVLIGLGAAGVGVFAIGSRQWLWQDTFHVRVGFRQIRGVEVGTRVRVMGREAGEVERVDLPATRSGEVVLRLRLDGKVRHLVGADASAQIVPEGMVGGKVVEIYPGSDGAEPVAEDALIAARPTTELMDVLGDVGTTLKGVGNGEGVLGQELVKLLSQGRGAVTSLKQNADAIKGMPLVRSYVKDPLKELVRPDCERNRQWYPEIDLFEPGHAVLTSSGRKRLDDLVPWLEGLKHKGSEVVVASFAAPNQDPDLALTLTQKQSDAVCDYLKDNHGVQKMGWLTRRKVTALGCGTEPLPEGRDLPLPRIEVLVFVPQG